MAIDDVLARIASAPTFDAAPSGTPALTQNVVAPVVVAIIVVGIAATVVGSVYVWKKLDPELQADLGAIRAASDAYRLRVEMWLKSGRMPPPGPLEAATAEHVKSAAKHRRNGQLLWGLAFGAGTVVAAGGAALVLKGRAAA